MTKLVNISGVADFEAVPGIDRLSEVRAADIERHRPDSHWLLLDDNGHAAARGSVWWNGAPSLPERHPLAELRAGTIGHYAAVNDASGVALLNHLCAQLAGHGCSLAIGPMDGNTWRRYRFVTDRGTESPFFLEPSNKPEYPDQWRTAGFEELAGYTSGATTDLTHSDPRLNRVRARIAEAGITLRPIDPADFESELRRIFAMSLVSFQSNFLYTPISEAEFLGMYRAIEPYVRPELTIVAEEESRAVGFLFAVPDLTHPSPDTIIIKTLAVLPGRRYAGLGALLAEECHKTAARLGYRRAIHALMYDGNESRNISNHTGETIRRYSVFSRRLTQ